MNIDRLREAFSYDATTGKFAWRISPNRRICIGATAGAINNGYVVLRLDGQNFMAHRVAWAFQTGEWPEHEIDHVNRRRADNRWCNLRHATRKQNAENTGLFAHNRSGSRGVNLYRGGRWRAFIGHQGKRVHLGYFDTKEMASAARREAETRLFTHSPEACNAQ